MTRRDDASPTRILLSAALTLTLIGLLALAFRVGAQEQPAPAQTTGDRGQPLAFSHRVHARDNAIPCQLCHAYARRGPVAGIPSVQRCVQCHLSVAPTKPEIVKLMASWKAKKPIAWLRVHDLPDYVRFTHKRHVLAGVACQTCHGDVAQMEAASQTAPLTMGWCLNCHKERRAPTDCLACHY
jgi:hypothetical protein